MQIIASSTLNEHDVAIFISYSGSSKELVEMAKRAHSTNCRTIGITNFTNSPSTNFLVLFWVWGAFAPPLQEGASPSKMAHLFMLDLLFTEVYRSRFGYSKQINQQVTDSISNKIY